MALKFPDILEHNNPANPLVDITELRGNSYPIGELDETGSIPSNKRNLGAIVFASSSQEFYGFYGATTESADWDDTDNWRTLSTFTGSYSGSFTGSFSGSVAELSKIVVDGQVSASLFSGSFVGDGTGLTGLPAAAIATYTNPADNRIITSVDSSTVNAEANLTFDGSTLAVTGDAEITGNTTLGDDGGDTVTINAGTIDVPNIEAGTDNSVVVYNGSTLVTDEIDSRVWGTTLVDAANGADNRIATFTDANSLNGEANLTYDGSILGVTGTINASSTITGSGLQLTSVPAGTDNTVLILASDNTVSSDEIDSRVWGTTLLDGSLTATRVPYASDSDTLIDSTNLTFNGTTLVANAATITTDLLVSGDLTVVGTASFQHTDSLTVADRFILLASGSNSEGMGGLVIQQDTQDVGEVFSWDNTTSRWATTGSFNAATNTFTPEAFMASVIDIDGGNSDIAKYQKNGNIRVESGDIYIYS